jgi:hypothetical protein
MNPISEMQMCSSHMSRSSLTKLLTSNTFPSILINGSTGSGSMGNGLLVMLLAWSVCRIEYSVQFYITIHRLDLPFCNFAPTTRGAIRLYREYHYQNPKNSPFLPIELSAHTHIKCKRRGIIGSYRWDEWVQLSVLPLGHSVPYPPGHVSQSCYWRQACGEWVTHLLGLLVQSVYFRSLKFHFLSLILTLIYINTHLLSM